MEKITIVEGQTPMFVPFIQMWAMSIIDYTGSTIDMCELRTFDGPTMVQRCTDAWSIGDAIVLDYPVGNGTRSTRSIVAASWGAVAEGHKLYLWVRR